MEAASTMEPSAPMKSAATMEATANRTPSNYRTVSKGARAADDRAGPEAWSAEESRAADEAGVSVAVKPRTRPDEEAAAKPFRPVVANWRARIWVIRIVAVVTDRSGAHVSRSADSDADYDSLRVCERSGNQADAKYRENS
jgi:hypothetical protein